MSIQSTIDSQIQNYNQLYLQHQTARREHQDSFLQAIQSLADDLKKSLLDDKRAHQSTKEIFRRRYNLFQRHFTRSAAEYKELSVRPLKHIYRRREDLSVKVTELLHETTLETNPTEIRTHWNGSIAVVYNPITGRAEWKQYWHGGIHGAFNPVTRTVEWQEESRSGVYGVFNPKLNIVEWKKFYKGGVHGVHNPSTDAIEWYTSFHSGVGGVYNPSSKQVEWKTSFNGGVVGYFDNETQTVKWMQKWHHGMALIVWDSTANTYLTTSSCGWYGDKS